MTAVAESVRPRLRGVSHRYAFVAAIVLGVVLGLAADGTRERLAISIFAAAVTLMFGASALYHAGDWSPATRRRLRRLDHSMIYLWIAGAYTPFGLLVLSGAWAWTVLAIVWSGAAAAIAVKVLWLDAPKWIAVGLAVAIGWVGIAALPVLLAGVGPAALALLLAGGLLYTLGGLVYATHRPDPAPAVFGFHEVFHLLVIGGAACHYAAVAFFVV